MISKYNIVSLIKLVVGKSKIIRSGKNLVLCICLQKFESNVYF